MKAGQALGLLAGLGALNALSGGRNGTGQRFTGLLDMLDGGGAGQSGDRFEGGGLLSMLGNLFAKPLEAQDNVERIARDTSATNALTEVLKQAITPEQRASAAMVEENRQRGLLEDRFDSRNQQGATSFRNRQVGQPQFPAQSYANMPMGKLGRGTPMPTTGTADMPPELLPMFTIRNAYDDLFNRSEGRGALMSGYSDEKKLIEIPEFARETDLSEIDYRSLMPPELLPQPQVNASVYESVPEAAELGLLGQQNASSEQLTGGLPLQSNVYTKQGYAQRPSYVQTERGMDLPPDVAMSRAMEALRQRFPNATPEQLANAAAMMGM
jgi:hypothetical protein